MGLGYRDKLADESAALNRFKDQIKVDTRMKALLECAAALCGRCSEGDRPENRIEFSFRRSHIWKTGNGHSICEASLIWDKLIEPQSPTCHGLGYRDKLATPNYTDNIHRLMSLLPGWDGGDAPLISSRAMNAALDVLETRGQTRELRWRRQNKERE